MPSVPAIMRYWKEHWPSFLEDEEEPNCFACHVFADEEEGCPRLQRCHIVADSAGGSSDPSNFLILCEDCHRAAPMINERTALIQWAHERPNWVRLYISMAIEALHRAGLEPVDVQINQFAFHEFLRSRALDFHPHSTRLDKMTCIAFLLREYMDLQ